MPIRNITPMPIVSNDGSRASRPQPVRHMLSPLLVYQAGTSWPPQYLILSMSRKAFLAGSEAISSQSSELEDLI